MLSYTINQGLSRGGAASLDCGGVWGGLNGALHGEDEGAEAQFGGRQVHLVQLVEDGIHAAVVNDGEDG